MSPLGPLMFRKAGGNTWDAERSTLSEETARRVDDEVREIVMRGYETARQLLQHYRPAMKAVAEQLLEVESLDGDEFKEILDRFVPRVN